MLRRIFGFRRNKIVGGWRNLRNEEINDFYFSSSIRNQGKENDMGEACNTHGGKKRSKHDFCKIVRKKQPLRGSVSRRENNIEMDLRKEHI
jgi:hypothetical protein